MARHAGAAGLRWFRGLERGVASLAEFPKRCPLAPENNNFPFEVRHLLYGRKPNIYRVVFTVKSDKVIILHILHGRREAAEPN